MLELGFVNIGLGCFLMEEQPYEGSFLSMFNKSRELSLFKYVLCGFEP